MSRTISVGARTIGDGHPCFVIAEAGSNHNGSLDQAKRLIDVASQAGVDAVKFQLFRASKLYPRRAGQSDYLKQARSIYDIIWEMEMPYDWLPELAACCEERRVLFMASAFDEGSVDRLDPFVSTHKIASYEMTHWPLLRAIAQKGKPVILSTGTADLAEVQGAVRTFLGTGNQNLMLMQCTAAYPAPVESLNLKSVVTMRKAFGVPVGFSDHSRDPVVGPVAAVALGANLIEKHFTLSNDLPGPDHGFALEPDELSLMVQKIRETEKALGSGEKVPHPVEKELRSFARRHIFAVRDIAAGERFTRQNAAVLRSGNLSPGLEPKHYDRILEKVSQRHIPSGSAIREGDYA